MTLRLQSNDLSIEHWEKCRQMIDTFKADIAQLKQEQRTHLDEIRVMHDQVNQANIERNQLTFKAQRWKDELEQREQWIDRLRQAVDHNTSGGISLHH